MCAYKVMITPVVYSGFLLQNTGLVSELGTRLFLGCGRSSTTVLLNILLIPGEIDVIHNNVKM